MSSLKSFVWSIEFVAPIILPICSLVVFWMATLFEITYEMEPKSKSPISVKFLAAVVAAIE